MTSRQVDPQILAKEFKSKPTLENFLQIRSRNPDVEFDVSFLGGLDHAFALEDFLGSYGVPIGLYIGILDANESSIRKMSMLLMEDMLEEEQLKRDGQTHIAARKRVMPQHLRDWLTCCMVGALSWNDNRYICNDLIALLHFRLNAGNSRVEEMADIEMKRLQAGYAAGILKAQGKPATFRAIARRFGVQASTVKRWFVSEAEFQNEADRRAILFDSDGQLRPLSK